MYTVKQLSELASISVRTLHYYDEIGLLKPTQVGQNGYRRYDDTALLRLQQILFYREIGLELQEIKDILDQPDFDLVAALQTHRAILQNKVDRLQKLVRTVDNTIMDLKGERGMARKQLFEGFSEEKQKDYERSMRLQYGPDTVNESVRRWKNYSQTEKQAIGDQGNQVFVDLAAAIEAGAATDSPEVRAIMERWHHWIQNFYEPTFDILRGMGELYTTHVDFIANFKKIHPELGEFMKQSIVVYVDELETAALERLMAEDEKADSQGNHA